MSHTIISKIKSPSNSLVFVLLWTITFILYLPAVKAGWVIDAAGWLYHVRHDSFWDYLNRPGSQTASLYQFTQLATYLFYKIWGANVWAWSLLYITIHTFNAVIIFIVFTRLFTDTGLDFKKSRVIVFTGVLLWTICPHISEVIIWKASYHYLQGFLMILLSVYWVQKYQYLQKIKYPVYSLLVFLCSSFSLEVFYLTPFYIFSIICFYHFVLKNKKEIFNKSITLFFAPQAIIMIGYAFLFHWVYKDAKPHIYNLFSQTIVEYLSKVPAYLFHILLLGRYFPFPFRLQVYAFCSSVVTLVFFYSAFIYVVYYLFKQLKKNSSFQKIVFLVFILLILSVAILLPLPFPYNPLLIFYDRYTYIASVFVYILVALLTFEFACTYLATSFLLIYGSVNLYFTMKINFLWKHAAYVDSRLLHQFPNEENKTVLLLNVPENMNGVAMIGANPDGAFKSLRALFVDTVIKNPVYDVLSYNLAGLHDGVYVAVKNDSTLKVIFNQTGNWWSYDGKGAQNYENEEYKVRILKYGTYRLTLKHPHENYLFLYETDGMWMKVDWIIEHEDYIDDKEFDPALYDEIRLINGERVEYK